MLRGYIIESRPRSIDTLLLVQCWRNSTEGAPVRLTAAEMEADLAPVLEIAHREVCEKNQGIGGEDGAWCFYGRLRPADPPPAAPSAPRGVSASFGASRSNPT